MSADPALHHCLARLRLALSAAVLAALAACGGGGGGGNDGGGSVVEAPRVAITEANAPNVAAQASKWARLRASRPAGSRKRCTVYISTIVLLMGVPVAKVTPWPGCCWWRYWVFMKRSKARSLPPVWMPATRSILVGVSRFLNTCDSSIKTWSWLSIMT